MLSYFWLVDKCVLNDNILSPKLSIRGKKYLVLILGPNVVKKKPKQKHIEYDKLLLNFATIQWWILMLNFSVGLPAIITSTMEACNII